LGLEEPLVRTTAHQRRKKGAKVGRQAHTMPMKGSTHDQTKTGDMVQVGSDDLTLRSRVTMRTMLAMQTLESGRLAWWNCFVGGGGGGFGMEEGKMDSQAS
jgi:hypothetical protein